MVASPVSATTREFLCDTRHNIISMISAKQSAGRYQVDYVMWRESRCRQIAFNPDDPMGGSYGLFQINAYCVSLVDTISAAGYRRKVYWITVKIYLILLLTLGLLSLFLIMLKKLMGTAGYLGGVLRGGTKRTVKRKRMA